MVSTSNQDPLMWNIVQLLLCGGITGLFFVHDMFYSYPPDLSRLHLLFTQYTIPWFMYTGLVYGWFKAMEYAQEHNNS